MGTRRADVAHASRTMTRAAHAMALMFPIYPGLESMTEIVWHFLERTSGRARAPGAVRARVVKLSVGRAGEDVELELAPRAGNGSRGERDRRRIRRCGRPKRFERRPTLAVPGCVEEMAARSADEDVRARAASSAHGWGPVKGVIHSSAGSSGSISSIPRSGV